VPDHQPMIPSLLATVLASLHGKRVVVVGDVVLDEYLIGRATRLSREAPVPVLELVERSWRPGAGANPAANVAALGGESVMVGVVGTDASGQRLLSELTRAGVDTSGLVVSAERSTAIKTRILATHASAHPQQVARIDDLPPPVLPESVEGAVIQHVETLVPHADAVLVSNYGGGVVTTGVIRAVANAASDHAIPTCVDTQGDLLSFEGFTLVKSNQPDAEAALGQPFGSEEAFRQAGATLVDRLRAHNVVITRGAEGMSVIGTGGRHTHLPPTNRTDVWDVTGAGDTVIAVLALGLAARADPIVAAQLANAAAGLVVRRIGVATVSPSELLASLQLSVPSSQSSEERKGPLR
jgi:rfaE bifunctional protein kinase chain/domain